jgi:hypothetical protein
MKTETLFVLLAASLAGCASTAPAPVTSSTSPNALTTQAPSPAATQESTTRPTLARRDTIMATGYSVIGVQNHKNPAQQRLLAIRAAKIDAYRGLAEQVYGLHLDANTAVSDMTVMSDSFRTRVEGVIQSATLTTITPINQDTYEVTLTLDLNVVNDLRVLYLEQLASKRR